MRKQRSKLIDSVETRCHYSLATYFRKPAHHNWMHKMQINEKNTNQERYTTRIAKKKIRSPLQFWRRSVVNFCSSNQWEEYQSRRMKTMCSMAQSSRSMYSMRTLMVQWGYYQDLKRYNNPDNPVYSQNFKGSDGEEFPGQWECLTRVPV